MSLEFTWMPATSPVIRQRTDPPLQRSCWMVSPFDDVGCGSPRCHRPLVTLLRPGVNDQPRATSKSSLKSTGLDTVNEAELLSTEPAALVTSTRNCAPVSAAEAVNE